MFFFQIPITPFDNKLALAQMELAYTTLLNRPIVSKTAGRNTVLGKDGQEHPRIVRLSGCITEFSILSITPLTVLVETIRSYYLFCGLCTRSTDSPFQ